MERVCSMVYRFQLREAGNRMFKPVLEESLNMRSKARSFGLLTLVAAFVVLAFGASSAQAEFGIKNWESLTCEENVDTPSLGGPPVIGLPPLTQSGEQCTEGTPEKWFTQAAGHPPFGITDFTLNTLTGSGAEGFPDGFVNDIVVETPEGLSVNPEALPQCSLAQAETNILGCPPESLVGINYLTVALKAPGPECVPKCPQARAAAPVYNVETGIGEFEGVPSMVAFPNSAGEAVYIVGSLDPVDQHVIFTISGTPAPPGGPPIVGSRLVFFGEGGPAGDGTYLTLPSQCDGPQKATLKVDSHEGDFAEETFPDALQRHRLRQSSVQPYAQNHRQQLDRLARPGDVGPRDPLGPV